MMQSKVSACGCDEYQNLMRFSRRDFLKVGTLGALGLSLSDFFRMKAAIGAPEGKAKSVILLWIQGGVTHHDTFDLKPEAPMEVRGELKPIKTNVDGIEICELMPKMAQVMDKVALIRSVTHPEGAHERGMRYMLSGWRPDTGFPPPLNYPDMGSVVAHELGMRNGMPPYVCVPGSDFTGAIGYYTAGYLGRALDPFWSARAADLNPPPGVAVERRDRRRSLAQAVDSLFRKMDGQLPKIQTMDKFYEQAYSLISSTAAKKAFDLSQEPQKVRELYGPHHLGPRCLLARRLVEAGVRFVTVGDDSWDHHGSIFRILKDPNRYLPNMDQAFSALIKDLDERGLLDETLVVFLTEFGRTPRINNDAGRDHWPSVFSVFFAGAGIKGGQVIGSSDRDGAYPKERPVTPEEIAATIFHILGIDFEKEIIGPNDRPFKIVYEGKVIPELLA